MAESKDHCITCGHAIPEGQDHPGYFGQNATRNSDAGNFLEETRDLLRYTRSVFVALTTSANDLDEDVIYWLHQLGWSLAEEAMRRLDLADTKMQEKNYHQTAGGKED